MSEAEKDTREAWTIWPCARCGHLKNSPAVNLAHESCEHHYVCREVVPKAALSAAEERAELYRRQLEAVDRALPPWESEPGGFAVGRVQTILNLVADRAKQD